MNNFLPKKLFDFKLAIKITKFVPDKIFINIQNLTMTSQSLAKLDMQKLIIYVSIRINIFGPFGLLPV